jgi:hypothetical protein
MDIWYDSLDGGSARRKASTYTGQHNKEKRGHTSMPRAGFEPTIPMFERPKTVRASDHAAIGTGNTKCFSLKKKCKIYLYQVSRFYLTYFITAFRLAMGSTQPPIQWVLGALSLRVKRLGREADHSHLVPTSRNEWSYTSTPTIPFNSVVLR